jgi:isocitrate lyase
MIRTSRSQILDSFYFQNQTWGALHKAWKGYVIAKNKYEADRMYYYATVIQKLQKELGLSISSFPDLGLFGGEDVDDGSDCEDNQEMTEEELLQEQMKQDREFFDQQRNQ